jgi:hypothetical protein
MANYTWDQLKAALGNPIILITFTHPTTGKVIEFTTDDLPLTAQTVLLQWINSRLP